MDNPLSFIWKAPGTSVFHITGNVEGMAALEVDTLDEEDHDWQNDVTMYPREMLPDGADGIKARPDELNLRCMISNAPVRGWIEQYGGLVDRMFDGKKRTQEAFNQLREFRRLQTPVTVVTRYRTYSNMGITALRITRTPEAGDCIEFTISLREIFISSTKTAKVPAGMGVKQDEPAAAQKAGAKVDTGQNKGAASPADQLDKSKSSSLAIKGAQGISDFLKNNGLGGFM